MVVVGEGDLCHHPLFRLHVLLPLYAPAFPRVAKLVVRTHPQTPSFSYFLPHENIDSTCLTIRIDFRLSVLANSLLFAPVHSCWERNINTVSQLSSSPSHILCHLFFTFSLFFSLLFSLFFGPTTRSCTLYWPILDRTKKKSCTFINLYLFLLCGCCCCYSYTLFSLFWLIHRADCDRSTQPSPARVLLGVLCFYAQTTGQLKSRRFSILLKFCFFFPLFFLYTCLCETATHFVANQN